MTKEERKRKIEQADQLIRLKATGTPENFAEKLNISTRYVYQLINYMRDLGAPICYCKGTQRYYYEYEVEFFFGFRPKEIDPSKIVGGCSTFFEDFSGLHDLCSSTSYLCGINVENRNWVS